MTPHAPCLAEALTRSQTAARQLGHPHIGPQQLLLGLLGVDHGSAARMLAQVGIRPQMLQPDLEQEGEEEVNPAHTPPLTNESEHMLYIAQREASFWESEKVETMHLLLALLRDENSPISRLFSRHGVQYQFLFDLAAYDRVGLSLR